MTSANRFYTVHCWKLAAFLLSVIFAAGCETTSKTNYAEEWFYSDAYSEDTLKALSFINKGFSDTTDRTIDDLLAAIEILDTTLATNTLTTAEEMAVRALRAEGYRQLASIRYTDNNKEIKDEEIERALADYDIVLASDFSGYFPDAAYLAGQLAYNFLQSERRASAYWLRCAAAGHAGCLNIAASGSFTGTLGFELSIQDSINFHTMVFDTGNTYQCAGGFSGMSLAQMATFLPGYTYRDSWRHYLSESLSLISSLAQSMDAPGICNYSTNNISAFLLHLAHGEAKPAFLRKALLVSNDNYTDAIAKLFLGEITYEAVDSLERQEEDTDFCYSQLMLMLHARIIGQDDRVIEHARAIRGADPLDCFVERAWIRELKILDEEAG